MQLWVIKLSPRILSISVQFKYDHSEFTRYLPIQISKVISALGDGSDSIVLKRVVKSVSK